MNADKRNGTRAPSAPAIPTEARAPARASPRARPLIFALSRYSGRGQGEGRAWQTNHFESVMTACPWVLPPRAL